MSERLDSLGEDALVDRLTHELPLGPEVIAGAGDDCAVMRTSDPEVDELLKTDCLVENVHFTASMSAEKVGRKALCRCLSDIAAMAGEPRAALVTIAVPGDREVALVDGWYRGLKEAAARYGVSLVGGETTSMPGGTDVALISIAMTGRVRREFCLRRSGAEIGDLLVVTGRLGGSFASGRHLEFEPRLLEAKWLAETWRPTAMMDLSDGLAKDLPRLAKASGGVGWRLDLEALPLHQEIDARAALTDGEDYELLLTMPPDGWEEGQESWRAAFPGLPLTVIGQVTETIDTPLEGGWDHFAKQGGQEDA